MATDTTVSSAMIDSVTSSLGGLLKQVPVVGKMFGSMASMTQILDQNAQTWQALTASGASFDNNLLQMASSAANARLTLTELTKVVQDNSKMFAGLTGNVSTGSMMFTRASKHFFDETASVATQLRALGYTNTDLNEVLALQLSTYRGSAKQEAQRIKEATDSTAKLATEMDLLAKLTGVSRKEQLENMQKARTDMIAEARIREIAAKEGKSIDEVRQVYQEQLNRAMLNGVGQMFKEQFAYGNVISKEAGEQQAIIGAEAARAVVEQVKATTQLREDDATAFSDKTTVALSKMLQTPTFLNLAKIPGEVGDVARALLEAVGNRDNAITSFIAQNQKTDGTPYTRDEALLKLLEKSRETQEQQSLINKAVLQYQQVLTNVNATAATGLKSLVESDPVSKILEKIVSGISSTNLGITNLSALYPKLNEHLLKISEFEKTGNTKQKNAEISLMNKELASAIKPLPQEIQNAITVTMNSIVDGIRKAVHPDEKPTESTAYSFGKALHDFFTDARPLSVKISEIPGKIGDSAIHYFVQEALSRMNLPASPVPQVPQTVPPHMPLQAKAVGGKMNPGESYALNVQGIPQTLHKEANAGPEWVFNQQQVGLMQANFSQSLMQNRGILASQQDISRTSMQTNAKFLQTISDISSSFKLTQNSDGKFEAYFDSLEDKIGQSFSTLDFTNITNLVKETNNTSDELSASLLTISDRLQDTSEQKSNVTETLPAKYSLSLDHLTRLPRSIEVAEQVRAEKESTERLALEKEVRARAEQDAKKAASLKKDETEKGERVPVAPQPDKSVETLTAILHAVDRLNMQTRELIDQDSKLTSNLINATKRAHGFV